MLSPSSAPLSSQRFSETLVSTYESIRRQNPEHRNPHRREHLKSHKCRFFPQSKGSRYVAIKSSVRISVCISVCISAGAILIFCCGCNRRHNNLWVKSFTALGTAVTALS
jgi:hypothetical protein